MRTELQQTFAGPPDGRGLTAVAGACRSGQSASPTGYTFLLREDGVSHNGTPLTVEVMKLNLDRIAASETQSQLTASLLGPYDYTEIVDDLTVRAHFTPPHAASLEAASQAFLGGPVPA